MSDIVKMFICGTVIVIAGGLGLAYWKWKGNGYNHENLLCLSIAVLLVGGYIATASGGALIYNLFKPSDAIISQEIEEKLKKAPFDRTLVEEAIDNNSIVELSGLYGPETERYYINYRKIQYDYMDSQYNMAPTDTESLYTTSDLLSEIDKLTQENQEIKAENETLKNQLQGVKDILAGIKTPESEVD